MYKEKDIVYEADNHWVLRTPKGFEVYKTGLTASTRCAVIGFKGDEGQARAIAECDRRGAA